MTHVDFPFRVDGRGRTGLTDDDDHIRDLVEQVLFTSPGERVNRPDFGSGLLQNVFAPNSPELAAALRFGIEAGLQRWLGEVIELDRLEVTADDARLIVDLRYRLRATGELREERFESDVTS